MNLKMKMEMENGNSMKMEVVLEDPLEISSYKILSIPCSLNRVAYNHCTVCLSYLN